MSFAAPVVRRSIPIGDCGDRTEHDADRIAATVTTAAPERLPETTGATPSLAPGSGAPEGVRAVLASPGAPLDASVRNTFERRFGHDFSRVRVHHDDAAARSAQTIGASAYTAGYDVVFAAGRYAPQTPSGERLIAHELTHVAQQQRTQSLVVQRAVNPDQDTGGNSIWDRAFALADESRWEQVAEIVNGFSPENMRYFLQTYKKQPDKIAWIHVGATANKKVGAGSALAQATRVGYLDFNFQEEMRKANWMRAAFYINGFNADDIRTRLAKIASVNLKALHDGAVDNPDLGVDSAAAKVSAEILAGRSAQGDSKALILPRLKGEGKEALVNVMKVIDSIRPSASASGLFTITVDGQPQTLTAAQVADVRKKAAATLIDHLRQVRRNASTAVSRYNGQNEVDRKHWIVAPIVKTLGRVKDPGPTLLAFGASAEADVDRAIAAINAGNFAQAAGLLASAETSAISAMKMWQAYFEGVIGAGEMTITVLEITRDASFLTLAILATIATGGAAAAVLGEGGAAVGATAFGVELGTTTATAANVIAIGAPIVANVAEAGAKVSMGEKVDWGALVIDTAVQIIIARFGGRVTGGIAKAMLGNPATERLAGSVTEKVVHAAIMHVGSIALTTAAQDAYKAFKGQGVTWQTFIDDVIARLTDPKGLAIVAVTGAVSAAAHTKFGSASHVSTPEVEPTTPARKPPIQETPAAKPAAAAATTAKPSVDEASLGASPKETIKPPVAAAPDKPATPPEEASPQKQLRNDVALKTLRSRGRLNRLLDAMLENDIDPQNSLGYSKKEWQAFEQTAKTDPERAATELTRRMDRHGVKAELTKPPPEYEPESEGRLPVVPARPLDLPEYQEAMMAAQNARANLPTPPHVKTAAGVEGRNPTLSGYKPTDKYPLAGEATERAVAEGRAAGSEPEEHPFDRIASAGKGEVHGSHAEKQAGVLAPDKPVGVSKEMCSDCQSWYRARAIERGIPQFVDDPAGTRVFMIDGTVHFVPHPDEQSGFHQGVDGRKP